MNSTTLTPRQQLLRENQQLKDRIAELERLVCLDPLTGLTNRREFDSALVREWGRIARGAGPLALLLVDIDHFKQINDTYGHPTGDAVLKAVAAALRQCCHRATDVIARYGGEEFAIVLPDTHQRGAIAVAHLVRLHCSEIRIEGVERPITCSVGVAMSCEVGTTAKLIGLADGRLYAAKGAGRDCVVS
ncbi:MAG: GGDEF domain-containing protein [Cyanobacteria bacterium J06635_1]